MTRRRRGTEPAGLEAMARLAVACCEVYSEDAEDVVFTQELLEISDRNPRFRIIFIRRASLGFITADDMRGVSGELTEQDIFICGPPLMIRNLRQQFTALGVRRSQIHSEDFSVLSP